VHLYTCVLWVPYHLTAHVKIKRCRSSDSDDVQLRLTMFSSSSIPIIQPFSLSLFLSRMCMIRFKFFLPYRVTLRPKPVLQLNTFFFLTYTYIC